MLDRLPKILIAAAAAFGLFINLALISTLAELSAWTGVEDEIGLNMQFHIRNMNRQSFIAGFITFGLLGALCAAFISRRNGWNLKRTLAAIGIAFVVVGGLLGEVQNQVVSSIGHRLVTHYPQQARLALDTYYVQRLMWRDHGYKNTLVPAYTGVAKNSTEAELFRVNLFYLLSDPRQALGTAAVGKNLFDAYFEDFEDFAQGQFPYGRIPGYFSHSVFTTKYQTPAYDLQRIYNTAVVPAVLVTSIFSLITSTLILLAEIAAIVGMGSKGWLKVRLAAIGGALALLLTVPLFIDTQYPAQANMQTQACDSAQCLPTRPWVNWLFRFEVGVVSLIERIAD